MGSRIPCQCTVVDCASPFNLLDQFPDLPPGPHVFEVRANDNAEPADPGSPAEGNVDPTPAIHSWTMAADTTGPDTVLLTVPAGPTAETGVEIAFTGADGATPVDLLTFECSIDGSPFEPCASPHTIQGLTPGDHTVSVRAVDLALNPDPSPASVTWTQVGAPVTSIIDGPTNPSPSQDATFTFAADQTGVTFTCSLDGAAPTPCTSPLTVVGLVDGFHGRTYGALSLTGQPDKQEAFRPLVPGVRHVERDDLEALERSVLTHHLRPGLGRRLAEGIPRIGAELELQIAHLAGAFGEGDDLGGVELAQMIGRTQSAVSQIEAGDIGLSVDMLRSIIEQLGGRLEISAVFNDRRINLAA